MSHTVGSHSDDRGGESDYPCYCDVKTKLTPPSTNNGVGDPVYVIKSRPQVMNVISVKAPLRLWPRLIWGKMRNKLNG